MFKRIGLILLFIAVTFVFGFALYRMIFYKPTVPITPTNQPTNAAGGLPTAQTGAPTTITNQPAPGINLPTAPPPGVSVIAEGGVTQVTAVVPTPTQNATLSTNGNISYYNRLDGKFYHLLPDGTVSALSDKTFYNVKQATFAPSGNSAILEYPDGSNILYDFSANKQVTLPKHWEEFNFSQDGKQIAAKSIGLDASNRFLVVSNPDGSNAVPVQELGDNADKVIVNWSPTNQIVATSDTGPKSGLDTHDIYFIGKNHENFRSMTIQGLNFQPKWSPTGEQLLYSAASNLSDWKPRLWIVDASGDDIGLNRKMLSVDTWANKCTFADQQTLYCAVPTDLPRGAGLQPKIANSTPDTIIKVDLVTGLQTTVATPEGSHTVDSMMITADGSKLYFTDKGTGILNQIRLRN